MLMVLYCAKRQYFLLEKRVTLSIKICYAGSIVHTSCALELNIKFCGIGLAMLSASKLTLRKLL
jgi:hypothetical protein